MIEYGSGIDKGPAGQVGGGQPIVGGGDPFANIGHAINQGVSWVGSLSTVELVILVVAVVIGLVLFRRLVF